MININLIKCAIGVHSWGNPIKDEMLDRYVKICHHCNETIRLPDTIGYLSYKITKQVIINDIQTDNLLHAKQRLNRLLKKLGY